MLSVEQTGDRIVLTYEQTIQVTAKPVDGMMVKVKLAQTTAK